MDYNNDERYWNINLLNKWFAISSILFLISIIWMFLDDNDDEFKDYQRDFRKLETQVSQSKLQQELNLTSDERDIYENKYNEEKDKYDSQNKILDSLNSVLEYEEGVFYKANMDYLFYKAEVDVIKYQYESELVEAHKEKHSSNHNDIIYKRKYEDALVELNRLKLIKEDLENIKSKLLQSIKDLKADLKTAEENLNKYYIMA